MITIPELILFDTIKKALALIRADYATNIGDNTKSLLYKILNGNEVQRYKLFEQAIAVFITKDGVDPRHIDVNMFFNAKRAAMPTIHITLPSEGEKDNAVGNSEGFRDPLYNDPDNATAFTTTYNRRFSPKYSIIITSDNANEVILVYHFIRSILISLNAHFALSGLENPKLSGGDIQISSEIIPLNIFTRSIGIEFAYDVEALDLFSTDMWPLDKITVDSVPLPIPIP